LQAKTSGFAGTVALLVRTILAPAFAGANHEGARMNSIKQLTAITALAAGAGLFCGATRAGTEDEVRAAFERFVQVQNAHDAKALEGLLLDSSQFLWITRGVPIWGRDAAVQRFAQNYQGTWKLDPEWASLRVVPVGSEVAHLFVPVQFTVGGPGQPPTLARFFINQVFLKTSSGWRVTSILPIPAPAP
jgi:uncharacterized protein DUF4440